MWNILIMLSDHEVIEDTILKVMVVTFFVGTEFMIKSLFFVYLFIFISSCPRVSVLLKRHAENIDFDANFSPYLVVKI